MLLFLVKPYENIYTTSSFFLSFDIESKAQESSLKQSIDNQYRSPLNKKRMFSEIQRNFRFF